MNLNHYPGISPVQVGVIKPRKVLSMSHTLAGQNLQTHNSSLANLVRGVGERVLFTNRALDRPIAPVAGVFSRLHPYRDRLVKMVGYRSPVAHEEFVGYYKGPRQLIYQHAIESLARKPCSHRDAVLKTFVKAEKHNLDIKPDPVPRVIQPRSPRFNVELGCFLRPIEGEMYDGVDKLFGSPTIMSHYNSYTQAKILREKWDKFSQPVCVGLDASRFDQHVSASALRFEHGIYKKIFKKNKKLIRLLRMQIENVGFASAWDGFFKYTKIGSRMSGDMNTSLGNKLLMCLMAYHYLESLGIPYSFANNGDDCLVFTERKYLNRMDGMRAFFVEFGFNIVREMPVYQFEQVEFCQTKPVCVNNIWRMVRNYKTCLAKDLTCINLGHNVEEYRAWLYDVGNCGLAVAADVPVLGVFYKMLRRVGSEGNYSRKNDNDYAWYYNASKNAESRHSTPDAAGRCSFWVSTGLSPDEQEVLEKHIDTFIWGDDKRQLITCIQSLFL